MAPGNKKQDSNKEDNKKGSEQGGSDRKSEQGHGGNNR
jgi:hypothetical protein